MLTRIYVDNFRCLVNFECYLGAQQLILGGSGAGKSTLFDVLGLLRDYCCARRTARRPLHGTYAYAVAGRSDADLRAGRIG